MKPQISENSGRSASLPRRAIGTTSLTVPTLGFGAAGIGNLYRVTSDADAADALHAAFAACITYVDTAPHYGQGLSERRVGAALTPSVIVSSKVGRVLEPITPPAPGTERHGFIDGDPFEPVYDYSYDGILRSFASSLRRLNRDRLDIVLVHDLGQATHGADADRHMRAFLDGGLRALTELKASGAATAIGLGVNEWQVAADVMRHADLDTVLLAGRYTLLEQESLTAFLPDCLRCQVSIILGGPFNSGILVGDMHYNYDVAPPAIVARVRALQRVCDAHGVPLAAAALQFPLAHPAVACVIPGMVSRRQVEANMTLLNTDIPAALWRDLKGEHLLHPDAPVPEKVAL